MSQSKGTAILFTSSDEVAKSASWHQLTKQRHRQRKSALLSKTDEAHVDVKLSEEANEAVRQLEEKIKAEKMRQQQAIERPHNTQPPARNDFDDDFEKYSEPTRRPNRSLYDD